MKRVTVTYRTLKALPPTAGGEPSNVMLVKTAEFRAAADSSDKAGYALDGAFLRAYGNGKTLLVPKAEVLEVDAED